MADETNKEIAELRKKFIVTHDAWQEVNNPTGWANGEVLIAWNKRHEALMLLVEAHQKYDKNVQLIFQF